MDHGGRGEKEILNFLSILRREARVSCRGYNGTLDVHSILRERLFRRNKVAPRGNCNLVLGRTGMFCRGFFLRAYAESDFEGQTYRV